MAKALALVLPVLLVLLSSFTVFAEELETLPPTSPHTPLATPPHYGHPYPQPLSPYSAPVHPPTSSPLHPPVEAPHHHHHHPPAPAPVKPPAHPPHTPAPAKPPTHPHYPPAPVHPPVHPPHTPVAPTTPVKPPVHPPVPVQPPVHPPVHPFPRSFVAVQGVVYVKSCKYAGVDTLLGATPVLAAIVKLQCNNTKYKLVHTAETDKNGYFFLEAPKTLTTFGAHKCNVVLVSDPTGLKPSNLHGGVTGALLRPEKPYVSHQLPFLLYTVGPLAFEPKCHH